MVNVVNFMVCLFHHNKNNVQNESKEVLPCGLMKLVGLSISYVLSFLVTKI